MNRVLPAVALLLLAGFAVAGDTVATDTPMTTSRGNAFTVPEGWSVTEDGAAMLVEAPEGGSFIVLVEVEADDADEAIKKGWAAYKKNKRNIVSSNEPPDADGWSRRKSNGYATSPEENRGVSAGAMYANDGWTVWIYDVANDVGGKRGSQIGLLFDTLLPEGYSRESFAGLDANTLDEERLAALTGFIEQSMQHTKVPGVALGIVQDGEVVFAGGFGVRDLEEPGAVDADTRFIVASNTKAMTTLLLAKLVDQGEFTWKTPVVDVMPSFRLGDEETTAQVLIEHLVCACTGLPRKDMQMIFEFGDLTANDAMAELAKIQPTSRFGEMYQYSNGLAGAAGFVAGHVAHPETELGKAYDMAMQARVFDELGMSRTTFDYDAAMNDNFANAHGANIDGDQTAIDMGLNEAVIHVRPAGGAWSTVNDMLRYVQMEIDEGLLADGERYIDRDVLLERRAAKVPLGDTGHYGMGLITDSTWGVDVVSHGGAVFGHYSQMMWLPEHGVGAVILTNAAPGWIVHGTFQRRFLEVLFDGKEEAEANMLNGAKEFYESTREQSALLDIPAKNKHARKLADNYSSELLGDLTVIREQDRTVFDFGEWRTEVATRTNPDGTISFVTIDPGLSGAEFVVTDGDTRALVMRDAQHEYVFAEE